MTVVMRAPKIHLELIAAAPRTFSVSEWRMVSGPALVFVLLKLTSALALAHLQSELSGARVILHRFNESLLLYTYIHL